MQIEDFEYLLAVADHASLGKAAEALGISQPALTKALKRIEAHAGLPLFTRDARGVRATPPGAAFIVRARRIWLDYQDSLHEMQQLRSGRLGVLRVGFSPTVVERLVTSAFAQLLVERPAARLQLQERLVTDLVDALADGRLDMILAPQSEAERIGGLSFEALYSDRFDVVCDRGHPLRRRAPVSLADLVEAEWVLPPPRMRVREAIAAEYRRRGLDGPRVRVEAEFGRVSMFALARGSALLTLCNCRSMASAHAEGLEALEVADLQLTRRIGIVTRTDGWRSPLAVRLAELMRSRSALIEA